MGSFALLARQSASTQPGFCQQRSSRTTTRCGQEWMHLACALNMIHCWGPSCLFSYPFLAFIRRTRLLSEMLPAASSAQSEVRSLPAGAALLQEVLPRLAAVPLCPPRGEGQAQGPRSPQLHRHCLPQHETGTPLRIAPFVASLIAA